MIKKILYCLILIPHIILAQKPISTAKPWAYWWWMGSAVDEKNITANMEDYAKAGFGGLHIIPIYGVKGEEARFIPFLSEKWVKMLEYTVKEGQRLGLGIDMTLGTGWPFGGSYVTEADAAKAFRVSDFGFRISDDSVKKSETQNPKPKTRKTEGGYRIDILNTKQKVKRAAPGAEGWVLDHFNADAVTRYFNPFDSIFSIKNIGVRAFYNDSYEVYGANWTPDFLKKFRQLRGYDLSEHLDVLAKDTAITDREKRIWADYHETLSDLLYRDFTKNLVQFGHKHGKIIRNEAHGAPANILDLYALCDVPETEFFGSKPFNIPLYRQDTDYDISRFGVPGDIVLKLASSAAHVAGRKLVSSETATWLGNHFKVSLSQIKPIVDESFVGGVNHIFYHGIPYSPKEADYPGWLFYASTNFNQQSHFWEQLPLLNGYIERCQTLLQNSKPDNDILLYFPLYDLWHSAGKNAKMHMLDVHSIIRNGLFNSPFGNTVKMLQNKGYAFDFVSDKQLKAANISKNAVLTEGGAVYKTIVIPKCDYMPLETLQTIEKCKKAGVTIIFTDKLPFSVNGYFNYEKRQTDFNFILKNSFKNNIQNVENQGIRRETLCDNGLSFIRKKTDKGTLYFIVNHNQLFEKGTITLATSGESVRLFDPLFQQDYFIHFKKIDKNHIKIPLELPSGASVFIEVLNKKQGNLIQKNKLSQSFHIGNPSRKLLESNIPVTGEWQVDFIKGYPTLPYPFTTPKLVSWTDICPDTMAQYFSGTARYTLTFNVLDSILNKKLWIDLGDIRESAKVKLNGVDLGTAWSLPFRLPVTEGVLKKENNVLEIEVTNLSANRIRYMDKKGIRWKKFYDINMVDINYHPFNAADWQPVASGLIGEVKLMVLR